MLSIGTLILVCSCAPGTSGNSPQDGCDGKCDEATGGGVADVPFDVFLAEGYAGDDSGLFGPCVLSPCRLVARVTTPSGEAFTSSKATGFDVWWKQRVATLRPDEIAGSWALMMYDVGSDWNSDDGLGPQNAFVNCRIEMSGDPIPKSVSTKDGSCPDSVAFTTLAFRSADPFPVVIHNQCPHVANLSKDYGLGIQSVIAQDDAGISIGDFQTTAYIHEDLVVIVQDQDTGDESAKAIDYQGQPDLYISPDCRLSDQP